MNKHIKLKLLWPILFITFITAVFFYPVWFNKLIPLPLDTLVNVHIPWTEVKWPGYPAGVPFKNGEITDSVSQFYPWRSLVGEYWRAGKFPLWNPYMFSGVPLLATLHSAALYPLNVLYIVFSNSVAWTGLVILQIFLSGIFMYLFLKRLDLSKEASVLGAIAFSFSGYMIAWLEFATGGHAGLWLPLLLLFELKLIESISLKWLLPTALTFFFIFTAGDFQVPLYSVVTYLLFGIYLIGWQKIKSFKFYRPAGLLFLGLVSGTLLSLSQLLPTFELFSQSMRGNDPYIREYFFGLMDWVKITNFIWPDFFGNVTTGNYWARFGFNEYISFTGIVSIIFVIYGFFTKKIRGEFFFLFLLILSLFFLFPTPLGFLPYNLHIPALSTSSASRIIFLVDFCLAVLSAYGFSKWKKNPTGGLLKVVIFFIVLTLVVALVLIIMITTKESLSGALTAKMVINLKVSLRNMVPTTIILFSLIVLLGAGKYILPKMKSKFILKHYLLVLPFFIIVLAGVELLRFSWKYVSFSPSQFLYPKTATLNFLDQQPKPYRISGGIPTNLFMPYKFSSAEGYDSIYPLRYAQWLSAVETGIVDSPRRRYGLIHNFSSPLLNYGNVKYIIDYKKGDFGEVNKDGTFEKSLLTDKFQQIFAENRVAVFRNKDNLPRVWLTTNYKVLKEPSKIIKELENIQNQKNRLVVIEQEPKIIIDSKNLSSEINDYKETDDTIKISLFSSENSLLFVSQAYYPGWRAFVDKEETQVIRSNYVFQAIAVPKGDHSVELFYQPLSFKRGLITSFVTFILLVLLSTYSLIQIASFKKKKTVI